MSDVLGRTPCEICKGACCETFALKFAQLDEDKRRWIGLHGKTHENGLVEFNCRCQHLTNHGKCGIYETRPEVCKTAEVGGYACLTAIHNRRSVLQAAKIELAISRQIAYNQTQRPDGQGDSNVG